MVQARRPQILLRDVSTRCRLAAEEDPAPRHPGPHGKPRRRLPHLCVSIRACRPVGPKLAFGSSGSSHRCGGHGLSELQNINIFVVLMYTILILRQSSSQSSPRLPGGRVGFHLARKTRRLGGVHLRGCPETTAAEASSPRLLRLSERRRLWLCCKRALALTPKPSGGLSKACWLPEGRTSKSAWASSVTLALGNRTKAGLASSAKGSEWALALPESSCRLTKLSNAR